VEWFDTGAPDIRLFDADGSHLEFIDFGTNAVWSFDGRYLAYEDELSRLMVVEPPGGSSSVVYDPDDGFTLEEWSWAADSHTILVQTRLGTSLDRHFVSFDVAGIEVNHVTLSGRGMWSPSGDHIVFSDQTITDGGHGCFECWASLADANGNTMPLGMRTGTSWAPDGSVLMTLRPVNDDGTGGTELWLLDPYAETSSKMATRPILFGPSLSPDGRWIAVFGEGDIVRLIEVRPSDLIWSPTSEFVLVERRVQGSNVTTALDLSLVTAFELPGRKAVWSPTGASIAFEGGTTVDR
jgi:Tol biopolymer transport system component